MLSEVRSAKHAMLGEVMSAKHAMLSEVMSAKHAFTFLLKGLLELKIN
jgi:hypothetical protein